MNALVIPVKPRSEEVSQAAVFRRLRWMQFWNSSRQLYGGSRIRLITMILSSLIVCLAVFLTSYWGFNFVATYKIPFAGGIIGLLFASLFFTLGIMLVFSTGLIVYASLFNSQETRFLLCSPARVDQVFAMKLQSAIGFSSWGFLVLGGPILLAYGMVAGVPWHFYPLLPAYFLGYVLLPGSAGAIITLLVVNFFPRHRKQALIIIGIMVVAVLIFWGYNVVQTAKRSMNDRDSLQSLFDLFVAANGRFSPSRWFSQGILASARDDIRLALLSLCQIWSFGLMGYLIATRLAKSIYRRGYDRVMTGGTLRRHHGRHWLDRNVERLLPFRDVSLRVLFIKDLRTFRREPSQVGQLLVFAGLLLLCVMNARQFFRADASEVYLSGISFLNLSATGLLICAYVGRFIYPLISLEGRKFWILGLVPMKRSRLLWSKFYFALTGTLFFGVGMTLMGDLILGVRGDLLGIHVLTMALVCLGASGISVGMSAWLPNFRETDPSKIVVGFGGTISMILTVLYLALVLSLASGVYHLIAVQGTLSAGEPATEWAWVAMGVAGLSAVAATVLPIRTGIRTLEAMEF